MVKLGTLRSGDLFKLNDVDIVCEKWFYLFKQDVFVCWCNKINGYVLLSPRTLVDKL